MTTGVRRTGFYGVAGVLLASIIIIGFVASNNLLAFGMGTLKIRIMDKPVELEELWLTIDWIRIQKEDGTWEEILPDNGVFDLLTLESESMELSEDMVTEGSYNKIWLHVKEAEPTFADPSLEGQPIEVPSDVVKIFFNPSINIQYGEETTVLIDLQPEWDSVSHSLNLRPVIKAVVTS